MENCERQKNQSNLFKLEDKKRWGNRDNRRFRKREKKRIFGCQLELKQSIN